MQDSIKNKLDGKAFIVMLQSIKVGQKLYISLRFNLARKLCQICKEYYEENQNWDVKEIYHFAKKNFCVTITGYREGYNWREAYLNYQ